MPLSKLQIDELLDENRYHDCEGYGKDKICVRIAAIGSLRCDCRDQPEGALKALGFRDDERDYSVAAHMIHSLKVKSVRLMTNNPKKIQGLQDPGVTVTDRISLIIPANEYNRFYLETRQRKSGHLLEQIDRPVVKASGEPGS